MSAGNIQINNHPKPAPVGGEVYRRDRLPAAKTVSARQVFDDFL
jgi:hypothetical protein